LGKNIRIEQIERLNLVLNVIRDVGRLLVSEKDKKKLIKGICDILVEKRGYFNAWIGLFDFEQKIELVADSGFESQSDFNSQFDMIREGLKKQEFTRCIQETLNSDKVFAVMDPVKECHDCILAEDYSDRGGLAVQVTHEGVNYGFMVLSIPRNLAMDETEKTLIKEMADDIAACLYRLDIANSNDVHGFLRVQDKMTSLGRVTAGIAHEIRNPLSGIYIYLKALKKIYNHMGDITRVVSIIDKIELASNKIESIIQRVMDFSKPGQPQFVMTDLNHYIDDVTKLTAVTLRKNGIQLIKDFDPDIPECYAEPHLIEQVILNLITNASEAMEEFPGEKRIELSTFRKGDCIVISVRDTGPGIPVSRQSRIFDPFYTTKANSSGIGLSISHRIIIDHGGTLKFSPSRTGGAIFIIEIPFENKKRIR